MIGENPQLELRPALESVGRLHERGLVDSLLFTTKPAIPRPRPRPEEARSAVSKDGLRARAVQGAHGSRRALARAPHHEVFETRGFAALLTMRRSRRAPHHEVALQIGNAAKRSL